MVSGFGVVSLLLGGVFFFFSGSKLQVYWVRVTGSGLGFQRILRDV